MFNNKKEIKELFGMLCELAEATSGLGERAHNIIGTILERIKGIEKHLGIEWKEETSEPITTKGYVQKVPEGLNQKDLKAVDDFIERHKKGGFPMMDIVPPPIKTPRKYLKSLKRPRGRYAKVTPEIAAQIKHFYQEGIHRKAIANRVGVSLATVGRYCK